MKIVTLGDGVGSADGGVQAEADQCGGGGDGTAVIATAASTTLEVTVAATIRRMRRASASRRAEDGPRDVEMSPLS